MERREFVKRVAIGGGVSALVGANLAMWHWRGSQPVPAAGEPLGTPDRDVCTIAFSLSGNQLVSVTADRSLSLWNSEVEKVVFTRPSPHRGGAADVSLFSDGGWLAAVAEDSFLSIWNSGKQADDAKLFRLESKPTAVAFSPPQRGSLQDSVLVAVSQEDQTVRMFEHSDPNSPFGGGFVVNRQGGCCGQKLVSDHDEFLQTRVLRPKYGGTTSLSFSPDGHVLAATSGHDYLQIWATRDWSQTVVPSRLNSPLHSTAFSSDSRFLGAGAEDGTVVVWDWRSRDQIAKLNGHGSTASDLAFCDSNNWIIVAYADGVIKMWPRRDANQGVIVGESPGKHASLSISADGKRLASSWGPDVKFWHTKELVAAARAEVV